LWAALSIRLIYRLRMDFMALIKRWEPPDEDAADMIEEAFLSYQIDAVSYALALLWLDRNTATVQ